MAVNKLKHSPGATVYSAVIAQYRGMVVGFYVNADWHYKYRVTWEDGRKSWCHECELRTDPLKDDLPDDWEAEWN